MDLGSLPCIVPGTQHMTSQLPSARHQRVFRRPDLPQRVGVPPPPPFRTTSARVQQVHRMKQKQALHWCGPASLSEVNVIETTFVSVRPYHAQAGVCPSPVNCDLLAATCCDDDVGRQSTIKDNTGTIILQSHQPATHRPQHQNSQASSKRMAINIGRAFCLDDRRSTATTTTA